MTTEVNTILNTKQINQKIRRIAYQIYESNSNEKELVLAGIVGNGYVLAEKLAKDLATISNLEIKLCKVFINKKAPLAPISTSLDVAEYKDKSLVLIDDVLNSGTTLIYGVKHFLDVSLKQFNTAVLVNRNHKKYPVKADFKGVSLSTSIKEHVKVVFDGATSKAFLV